VKKGQLIFIDDGLILLTVTATQPDKAEITCEVRRRPRCWVGVLLAARASWRPLRCAPPLLPLASPRVTRPGGRCALGRLCERVVERVVEREFTEAVADARGRGHCRLAAVRLGKARIVHEGSPPCR